MPSVIHIVHWLLFSDAYPRNVAALVADPFERLAFDHLVLLSVKFAAVAGRII
jgi:hypothetical protein